MGSLSDLEETQLQRHDREVREKEQGRCLQIIREWVDSATYQAIKTNILTRK